MNEHKLSAQGERRKAEIGALLIARARRRRVGTRILAGAGCLLLAVAATLVVRRAAPGDAPREIATTTRPAFQHAPPIMPEINTTPTSASAQVRIVNNNPLPTTKCEEVGSRPDGAVSVCILDDAQLLSMLAQTGQSYGLVKVGGKTRVVANLAHP